MLGNVFDLNPIVSQALVEMDFWPSGVSDCYRLSESESAASARVVFSSSRLGVSQSHFFWRKLLVTAQH